MSTQPSERQIRKRVASPAVATVANRHVAGRSQTIQAMIWHPPLISAILAPALVGRIGFEAGGCGPMQGGYRVGRLARKLQSTSRARANAAEEAPRDDSP